ncbi:glycosyltransferase [Jannaschia sp. W003]|uniref:glycosyltransferase n=1 Tax=Jannaschia sp. W003 TaxID=2867012 RepID=UPI0021A85365|nr:glycosyltransferase [Jannaschia sp. W003]UWQ19983.1 glycosyltransferase [Jannaschia sp. W003]
MGDLLSGPGRAMAPITDVAYEVLSLTGADIARVSARRPPDRANAYALLAACARDVEWRADLAQALDGLPPDERRRCGAEWFGAALESRRLGDPDAWRLDLLRAASRAHPRPWILIALSDVETDDASAARALMRAADLMDPAASVEPLGRAATRFLAAGRFEDALATLSTALGRRPDHRLSANRMIRLLIRERRPEAAARALDRLGGALLESDVHLHRSVIEEMTRGPEAAVAYLDAHAQAHRAERVYAVRRCTLLRRLGRSDDALEELSRFVSAGHDVTPPVVDMLIDLAGICRIDPAERLGISGRAVDLGVAPRRILPLKHRALEDQGLHAQALDLAREAIEADPADIAAYAMAVSSARHMLDDATVSDLIDAALRNCPDTPAHRADIAMLLLSAEENQRAREIAVQVIAQDPGNTVASRALLRTLTRLGDLREIQRRVEPLTALVPESASLVEGVIRLGAARALGGTNMPDDHESCARLLAPLLASGPIASARPDAPRDGGVVHVTGQLGVGGAERQCLWTAEGMMRRATLGPVSILAVRRRADHSIEEDVTASGVPLRYLEDAIAASDVRTALARMPDLEATARALAVLPPAQASTIVGLLVDFVETRPHTVHGWQDAGALAAVAGVLAGVPRIVIGGRRTMSKHNIPRLAEIRALYRLVLPRPDVTLLCNSHDGARSFERWLDLPRETAKVAFNGYDFDAMDRRAATRDPRDIRREHDLTGRPVVGLVARMHPMKRWHVWLDVLSRLPRDLDVVGLAVGDGVLRDEIESQARYMGLHERIRFVGRQMPPEPWFRALDLLVFVSGWGEGLPNTIIEAQALGVPVVTVDVGGAADTVVDGVTGRVVDVAGLSDDDVAAAVAQAAIPILEQPDLRSRMASQACDAARATFSIGAVISEIETHYERMAPLAAIDTTERAS